jgi:hypothetical protein
MLKAKSYTVIQQDGKADIECDAFSCRHCNGIVRVPLKPQPGDDLGGFCPMCHANICGPCADKLGQTLRCVPFEKRLEAMESRDRFARALVG